MAIVGDRQEHWTCRFLCWFIEERLQSESENAYGFLHKKTSCSSFCDIAVEVLCTGVYRWTVLSGCIRRTAEIRDAVLSRALRKIRKWEL